MRHPRTVREIIGGAIIGRRHPVGWSALSSSTCSVAEPKQRRSTVAELEVQLERERKRTWSAQNEANACRTIRSQLERSRRWLIATSAAGWSAAVVLLLERVLG